MSLISLSEAKAWVEANKFPMVSLNTDLLDQIEAEVLARVGVSYDTSGWLDPTTTPRILRVAIAKLYVAWLYDSRYSEDQEEGNNYVERLKANAEMLISGIADGTIELPGDDSTNEGGSPSFYPNDDSSAVYPGENDDYSYGPAHYSMGTTF